MDASCAGYADAYSVTDLTHGEPLSAQIDDPLPLLRADRRHDEGPELRSISGSPRVARRTHSRPRRSLIPAASDAARTDHACSETRLNSSARLAGQLRAFLCTFSRGLSVNLFV